MRERFFLMLHQFNTLFPNTAPRTWVIDRGIYGLDTFDAFSLTGDHFITWEKGYQANGFDQDRPTVAFMRCRPRNNSRDIQAWHFECQEQPWRKNPQIRQITVQVTTPNNNTVEVSVLCSNPSIALAEAVTLIFNRWIQENDFWYLDTHFGLLQITSYAKESYRDIEHTLRDRDTTTAEYRQLQKERQATDSKLKRDLLNREKKIDAITQCQQEEEQLESDIQSGKLAKPALKKAKSQVRKLKRRMKTLTKNRETLDLSISELKCQSIKLQEKLDLTLKDASRIEQLIAANYFRLDIRKKAVMDALRITARNIFGSAMQIFRPIYDNYRDDHVILRLISRSPGLIWYNNESQRTEIRIWLTASLQKHQLEKTAQFLQIITLGINEHFQGRAAPINLELLDNHNQVSTIS